MSTGRRCSARSGAPRRHTSTPHGSAATTSPYGPAPTSPRLPLDPDAVAAVLETAGRPGPRRRAYPAGLTQREVAVLRLLAQGLSQKEIAQVLVVSASTVHTHVVHIYEKAGVSTRAAAAMFALERGLLHTRAAHAKID